jgi:hypothetical protein
LPSKLIECGIENSKSRLSKPEALKLPAFTLKEGHDMPNHNYAVEDEMNARHDAEDLEVAVNDVIADHGGNLTLGTITDPAARARAEKAIARVKRDHQRAVRQHAEKIALHRAGIKAREEEYEAKLRRHQAEMRKADAEDRGDKPTKSFDLDSRAILKRFGKKTG